ncbi:MAG: DUF5106 domain-containing protein [Dysgonamonadaceae bacterium]|jgi:thiol-disulfide isomerase/thioredoxin|nr:DUF5106 domain-containing protein [Dysgonamonadaceae bacterium]
MKQALFLFMILATFGCKNEKNAGAEPADTKDTLAQQIPFVRPDIPALITEPKLRFEFLIDHYWDRFDFSDTTYVPSPEVTEQAWVDYIDLLHRAPLEKARKTLKAMLLKSAAGSKKHFRYFTEMADKYLYEPNSPVRNEELYISVLEAMIETPLLNDTEKMLPKHRLKNAYKNRVNTKAIDFQYTDRAGKTGALYRISAEYLLLFFNEPGCPSCKETIESIRRSPVMNVLASEGRLKVLSVYTGEEVDEWKAHYGNYPASWLNGYDRLQIIEARYDLRAIPTLYLLDGKKTVVLKDATFVQIENYLNSVKNS